MKNKLPSALADLVHDYVSSGDVNDIPVAYKDDMSPDTAGSPSTSEKKVSDNNKADESGTVQKPHVEDPVPEETETQPAADEISVAKKASPFIHKMEDSKPVSKEYDISPEAKAYRDAHLLELLEQELGSLKQQSFFFTTTEIAAIRLLTAKLKCKKRYVTMRLLIRYAFDNMLPGFLDSDEVKALASELKEEYDDTQQKKTRTIL